MGASLHRILWILTLVLFLGSGCVQTAMLPARQLNADETAVSVTIEEPGMLYVPRASGQLTYGLGGGDLSVNLGGTVGTFGGGVAGRTYLTDGVNAEIQAQMADVIGARQWLLQGGLQEVPSEENRLYIGGRLGVVQGTAPLEDALGGSRSSHTVPFIGASLGYGRIDLGGAWGMQIELTANLPIPPTAEGEDRPFPPSHLSVGLFRYAD